MLYHSNLFLSGLIPPIVPPYKMSSTPKVQVIPRRKTTLSHQTFLSTPWPPPLHHGLQPPHHNPHNNTARHHLHHRHHPSAPCLPILRQQSPITARSRRPHTIPQSRRLHQHRSCHHRPRNRPVHRRACPDCLVCSTATRSCRRPGAPRP